jgi:hypothetical protein
MSSYTHKVCTYVPNISIFGLLLNPLLFLEIIFTNPLELINILVHSINLMEIGKILILCVSVFLVINIKFPNINFKQNFISNKFYIFFLSFSISVIHDLVKGVAFSENFTESVFLAMVITLIYSFYTDLVINGFTDNFENPLRKILFFVFMILCVLCSMNLIKNLMEK